jgi:hypothetical protein
MEDVIHTLNRLSDDTPIKDRSLDKLAVQAIQVAPESRAQIVQNPYFSPVLKMLNNVTADEAGPTRDKYLHTGVIPLVLAVLIL